MSVHAESAERAGRPAARKASQGFDRETTIVGLDLLRAVGWLVLHDVAVPGDVDLPVDHVVAGRSGVFVINTVAAPGSVRITETSLVSAGISHIAEVHDLAAAAQALRARLSGPPVAPILCFQSAEEINGIIADVVVCSTENILELLNDQPELLDAAAAQEVMATLTATLEKHTFRPAAPVEEVVPEKPRHRAQAPKARKRFPGFGRSAETPAAPSVEAEVAAVEAEAPVEAPVEARKPEALKPEPLKLVQPVVEETVETEPELQAEPSVAAEDEPTPVVRTVLTPVADPDVAEIAAPAQPVRPTETVQDTEPASAAEPSAASSVDAATVELATAAPVVEEPRARRRLAGFRRSAKAVPSAPEPADADVSDVEAAVVKAIATPLVEDAPAAAVEPVEPKVEEPKVEEPEAAEPTIVEPVVAEPAVAEPKVEDPKPVVAEVVAPETVEPELVEPEVAEPVVTEPEVARTADLPSEPAARVEEPVPAKPTVQRPAPIRSAPAIVPAPAVRPPTGKPVPKAARPKLVGPTPVAPAAAAAHLTVAPSTPSVPSSPAAPVVETSASAKPEVQKPEVQKPETQKPEVAAKVTKPPKAAKPAKAPKQAAEPVHEQAPAAEPAPVLKSPRVEPVPSVEPVRPVTTQRQHPAAERMWTPAPAAPAAPEKTEPTAPPVGASAWRVDVKSAVAMVSAAFARRDEKPEFDLEELESAVVVAEEPAARAVPAWFAGAEKSTKERVVARPPAVEIAEKIKKPRVQSLLPVLIGALVIVAALGVAPRIPDVYHWGRSFFVAPPPSDFGQAVEIGGNGAHPGLRVVAGVPVNVTANISAGKGMHWVAVPVRTTSEGTSPWSLKLPVRFSATDSLGIEHPPSTKVAKVNAGRVLASRTSLQPGQPVFGMVVFAIPNGRDVSSVRLALEPGEDASVWQAPTSD